MSWQQKLVETYQNCQSEIGKGVDIPGYPILLPICHTTQLAQIEVVLDGQGNLMKGASRILYDKKDQETIIPCTDNSSGRAGMGYTPHPLFDKMQYIAKDYLVHGGEQKKWRYNEYIGNLRDWVVSDFSVPSVHAIYTYLSNFCIINDLISEKLIILDDTGQIISKVNSSKEILEREDVKNDALLKVIKDPLDAFVRFRVQDSSCLEDRVWLDTAVWNSFISYYQNSMKDKDYCYISGDMIPVSDKSPCKIRNTGDRTKLFSSNDKSGFTYRGRFTTATQAAQIGYVPNQMLHNALKWLVEKQGSKTGSLVYVAWGTKNEDIPDVCSDTFDLGVDFSSSSNSIDIRSAFAQRFNRAKAGYSAKLSDSSDVMIIGLDAATPGRLSVVYYQEYSGRDFLERLEYWHSSCSWLISRMEYPENSKKGVRKSFFGAPSPKGIIEAAYGERSGDSFITATIKRIIPCITEARAFPEDIMKALVHRASNPVAFDKKENWRYLDVLAITCAVVKKYFNDKENPSLVDKLSDYKEVWSMALDSNNRNRSYLFGRLLAYAQDLEATAMYVSKEDARQTNAERMMHQLTIKPAKTWEVLYNQLQPYFKRLGAARGYGIASLKQQEINSILDSIGTEGFSNEALSEVYILGYASQMVEFTRQRKEASENKKESN
ncbi:MAG: type I-C CRISPR-associated protein Cas8c/Csd1 [Sphaerochaetaceae bacterium]